MKEILIMMKHALGYAAIAWLGMVANVWAIQYNITLDSAQEVPPPTLNGATPSGTATVDVNTITGDVSVTGTFTGLTGNASAAHIHGLAPPGTPAGVLVPLTVDAAMSGNISGNGTLDAAGLTGLLQGQTYINIHTPTNGPGEIRGQIVDNDILVFDILLDSAQEVPPPVLNGATPSGTARVVVDKSSGLVEVTGTYTGLTTDVAAAHIHGLADPGTPAGVLFGFTTTGGTEGTFSGSGTLSAENLAGLLEGRTYVNVHTAQNGPGEIRGQVVPEPQSLMLLLLGALPLLRRRRR
jgi:hypothetical protein